MANRLKILIESHIPYIKGLLDKVADVSYISPESFTSESVADADALIVRTRTQCNESLLRHSKVSWIGTATIGTDHIDLDYCAANGITVASSPGCNAPAVAQYVLNELVYTAKKLAIAPTDLTLGIVGVGHIGKIVESWAKNNGITTLACDPPRAEKEGGAAFATLDEIAAKADVITFHTPLTKSGAHPTYHLCDTKFVSSLKKCRLLINAARGGVTDTEALLKATPQTDLVIDCWENEPLINTSLLNRARLATPHIAGYSLQGKMRATAMVVKALSEHFGLGIDVDTLISIPEVTENPSLDCIYDSCDLSNESTALKENPASFESLRNNYVLRSEP